ncbi:MAG: DEAD/DEAH box helicase [Clostridia bacterium]|nr:DEAD/DEAH box helicase [Clostridia bacterium]
MLTMNSNPIQLARTIDETLKRYIPTTLSISHNFPGLRKEFHKILQQQTLVKGPYVEALPDFEKGASLESLLKGSGKYLHDGLSSLPPEILSRLLHRHQEEALERSCRDNQSILVATGTGSGKTETFLYPIAHNLLSDPTPSTPGVRALLIYPMNALANDQLLYRIAPLFGNHLSKFNITFGRYTSQIRAKATRSDEEAKIRDNERLMMLLGGKIPGNWLLTREEMLTNPPKILLTNYAMLEHLLLLPRNAPLFKHATLQTIVLDEIHTYSGAQATEVAFLLRKLKTRLGIDTPIQVFGTSASLSDKPGADEGLIAFASKLFGEEVHAVVRGKREIHAALRNPAKAGSSFSASEWINLADKIPEILADEKAYQIDKWNDCVTDLGFKALRMEGSAALGMQLLKLFQGNKEIRSVADKLACGQVLPFADLATHIFQDTDSEQSSRALSSVIQIGMLARTSENEFPLLPCRYHIVANSIEGLCVSLDRDAPESWKEVRPSRAGNSDGEPMYPLMVCRRCGQPFIEGFELAGSLYPTNETGTSRRMVYWLGDEREGASDEADEDDTQDQTSEDGRFKYLDCSIGSLCASPETGLKLIPVTTETDEFEKRLLVKSCPACGTKASGGMAEVITHMHPGNEAMGAVICQQVLEFLPSDFENQRSHPFGGRTLLTFSDNRQDAAYFAPYFERTGNELALRTGIYQVLKKHPDELNTLEEVANSLRKNWAKDGTPIIIDGTGHITTGSTQRITLTGHVAAEFCTPGGRRNSLEAFGLVSVTYEERHFDNFIRAITPSIPQKNKKDALQLGLLLLEHIRREKAITPPCDGDVDMTDSEIWGKTYAQHRSFELERTQGSNISHAWVLKAANRFNRRTWFLIRQLGWSHEESYTFLHAAWEALKKEKLIVRLQPGFGLDSSKIFLNTRTELKIYRCEKCGILSPLCIDNKCTSFRCTGTLQEIKAQEFNNYYKTNHYYSILTAGTARTLKANEHTAALSQELRQQIEQDFASKNINLLSCTTTMEVGVDLGDLEAVVCLNIPPGISNYQQRTGRAGRRAQAAPFCVTFAKNGRYDQAVFGDFQSYLATPPSIPSIHLGNSQLFHRHQFSVILSGFLLHRIKDLSINAPSLRHVFSEKHDTNSHQEFMDSLNHWFEAEAGLLKLQEANQLSSRIPDSYFGIGLTGTALKNSFLNTMERLSKTISEQWNIFEQKKQEAATANNMRTASYWESEQKKFIEQLLVNKLSFFGIIPTYSFPIHSLSLEVITEQKGNYYSSSDIELSRDASLGISEYSPGCRVVANGRVWTSAGLAYTPKQFMPEKVFSACSHCNHVEVQLSRDDLSSTCPFCNNEKRGKAITYIEPHGFITEYKERLGNSPGQVRQRRLYADEARLISQAREDDYRPTNHPNVRKAFLSALGSTGTDAGRLFIVNKGPNGLGFHRCYKCNRMEPATRVVNAATNHSDVRTGQSCPSKTMSFPVCLAHEFATDIAIFRFSTPLPQLENPADPKFELFQNSMATTLSEAMRFAATSILDIQDNEIRSSFKIRDGYVDVILYDSVPGGAGYSKRLQDESMNALLEKSILLLTCKDNCDRACRKCLCDYSNQMRWEKFNRKPILKWLLGLLKNKDSCFKDGAEFWQDNSLGGISDRLKSYQTIHLTGKSLVSSESDPEDIGISWLLAQLHEGKTVYCHLSTDKPYNPKAFSPSERRCWTKVRYYIESGQLVLTKLASDKLPRLFADPAIGAPAFYSASPLSSILDAPLPNPAAIAIMNQESSNEISALLEQNIKFPSTITNEMKPEILSYKSGEKRNFETIFAPTKGAFVSEIRIEDPYCGSAHATEKLRFLLEHFANHFQKCDRIHIICKELNYNDINYRSSYEIKKALNNLVNTYFKLSTIETTVVDFKKAKFFHDRSIIISCISASGEENKHRFDLSGGIDYLFDPAKETKVYHYLENN